METMACNLIPVCSRTGFAEDLIVHKQNGFLLPKQFDAKNVKLLLNKASQVNWNTRDSIIYYNYQSYIEKFLPHY